MHPWCFISETTSIALTAFLVASMPVAAPQIMLFKIGFQDNTHFLVNQTKLFWAHNKARVTDGCIGFALIFSLVLFAIGEIVGIDFGLSQSDLMLREWGRSILMVEATENCWSRERDLKDRISHLPSLHGKRGNLIHVQTL